MAANVRDVLFGSTNFEFIVFGEMLSERTFDVVSAVHDGGFELNELRLRRYSGIVTVPFPFPFPFPFGTGVVVDIN